MRNNLKGFVNELFPWTNNFSISFTGPGYVTKSITAVGENLSQQCYSFITHQYFPLIKKIVDLLFLTK